LASGLVSAALPILAGLPIPLVGSVCRLGALFAGGLVAAELLVTRLGRSVLERITA
jgi:hypothetical protein